MDWRLFFLSTLFLAKCSSGCMWSGCREGLRCDGVANKCRNPYTHEPSCANDCPQGSYCGISNMCMCRGGWVTCKDCQSGFHCDPCGHCVPDVTASPWMTTTKALTTTTADPTACTPNCEPSLVCDAVANTCRDPTNYQPSCLINPCPSGAYCDQSSNMCVCDPRTKNRCPAEGCPVGSHCNVCNVCESDAVRASTTEITPITSTTEISTTIPDSSTCVRPSDCRRGLTCDYLAKRCRDPKTHLPSCTDDCPDGASCDLIHNICYCDGGKRQCEHCNPDFHCNVCGLCVPDTSSMSTTKAVATTNPGSSGCRHSGCQEGLTCDRVANRCRNPYTNTPSCANDCPQGSYCGTSNMCICRDKRTCKHCQPGFHCDACGHCVPDTRWMTTTTITTTDPTACTPNCKPPLVCDAVANTCRDPNTLYPPCHSKPCPSGALCSPVSNMCECDPRTKEHCPAEGCPVGSHCNVCNVCESDAVLASTTQISTAIPDSMTCDPTCEPQFICDAVRNLCVDPRTRRPSCFEKPCPPGALCNLAIGVCSCESGMERACPDEGCPVGYRCNVCNVCESDTTLRTTPEISTTIPAFRQSPMSKFNRPYSPKAALPATNGVLTINDTSPTTADPRILDAIAGAQISASNLLLITLSLIICVKVLVI